MVSAPVKMGRVAVPRYAFSALVLFAAVSAFFIFSSKEDTIKNPYILAGTEKSIMVQAVKSFHKILAGDVKLQYNSSNAAEVEKYVKDNANFKAYIPKIEDYDLQGCILNEYNGSWRIWFMFQVMI
jgi:hypothetical protein